MSKRRGKHKKAFFESLTRGRLERPRDVRTTMSPIPISPLELVWRALNWFNFQHFCLSSSPSHGELFHRNIFMKTSLEEKNNNRVPNFSSTYLEKNTLAAIVCASCIALSTGNASRLVSHCALFFMLILDMFSTSQKRTKWIFSWQRKAEAFFTIANKALLVWRGRQRNVALLFVSG
jgi:hypothetical protein